MNNRPKLETVGAWIVHHGLKLSADQAGASEFPAIDAAAKSGMLLAGMAASEQSEPSGDEVIAIAKAARLNSKTELRFALEELEKRQLIDMSSSNAVSVLGVSSRKVLRETVALYEQFEPTVEEKAAIDVAEPRRSR
jgi:hypothetical protein